jgi:hypothetical protein
VGRQFTPQSHSLRGFDLLLLQPDVCGSRDPPRVCPKGVRPEQASVLVGEHRLDLEFDPNFLADQETARLERLVPPYVEVLAG